MKLKTREDIEAATEAFINTLQQAAKAATPTSLTSTPDRHLPSEIKSLVAIKRRARSQWQKTHAPNDRRLSNNASNKLKAALHELRNASFTAYVSSLKRDGNYIWKSLKSRKEPSTPLPRFAKIQRPRDHVPRATKKKSNYSQTTLRKSSPLTTTRWIRTLKENLQYAPNPWKP
jgi:hypothetical protein